MNKREVEFIIDENGDLTMEVKGVKGTSCSKEIEKMLKELGQAPATREKTSEYYQASQQNIRLGGKF